MDKIIKQFNSGILPLQFSYGTTDSSAIDMEKLQYNAFYRSYEFYEQKFPPGYQNIPGFEKVIELCAENNKDNTPLKEIEKRAEEITNEE